MHDVAQASRETALQTLFEAIKPGSAARFLPLLHYKWDRTAAALAALFACTDIPVMQALGLYREEPYTASGGHQPVL